MKQISIIIPCFNTSAYVEKCLDSLVSQVSSFDYEIVLVDDCSKDNTVSVIKEYISRHDYNIKLIENEKNIGAGASRNKAVKAARYDYVSFIDSDDYISDKFYEEMLGVAEENNADVTVCDIVVVDENSGEQTLCEAFAGKPGKYELISTGLAASPCNKILKKEYLLKYPFAEGIINEDIACVLAIAANCEKIAYAEKSKYYYIQRSGSVQNSKLSDKKLDIVRAVDIFRERTAACDNADKLFDCVVFTQIICFLLFVPMKHKGLFSRACFLRKYRKATKKFNLISNSHFAEFLEKCSKKKAIYLKTYLTLFSYGLLLSVSALASLVGSYEKHRIHKLVIEKEIGRQDVINAAKENAAKQCEKTVTAAIPNYNYADFIYERLYSILYQNYKINEIIILDDCSKDNSREIIDDIVPEISKYVKTVKIYNEQNSGSPFKQWQKAFENATSDYLWIAEADDFCDKNLLPSLMKPILRDNEIAVSYADTAFINKAGYITVKSVKPDIDLMKTGHWNKSFVNGGIEEIKNYAFLNCTIANVSSAVFKREDYAETFAEMQDYHQVGDYFFYISAMRRGKVAYTAKPLNYYRVHGANVTSNTKKRLHLEELKRVHAAIDKVIKPDKYREEERKKRYDYLMKIWNIE